SSDRELEVAFGALGELRTAALLVGADVFFNGESQLLATLARRHAIPTAYQYREFAAAGGLMSYGGSLAGWYRQVGMYAGRTVAGPSRAPCRCSNPPRSS